jgi:hypothetical protein
MRAGVVLEANTSAYRFWKVCSLGEGVPLCEGSLCEREVFLRECGLIWNAEGLAGGEIRRTCEARREASQCELNLDLVDELPDFLPPTC